MTSLIITTLLLLAMIDLEKSSLMDYTIMMKTLQIYIPFHSKDSSQ